MSEKRLADDELSISWIRQFSDKRDGALGLQLLNYVRLVSSREFESHIERSIIGIQEKVRTTIAVYPIAKPTFTVGATGSPILGSAAQDGTSVPTARKRRTKFGSEDRVGHLLQKLQARYRKGSTSKIECIPTIKQIKTQKIKHIVLVDDICGSGKRIVDYWRYVVSKSVKSLLSSGHIDLWIVLYGITRAGRSHVKRSLPNFPIKKRLIVAIDGSELRKLFPAELSKLSKRYGEKMGMGTAALGYRNSLCPLIFEHGCPNNAPAILWSNKNGWRPLFPNRAVPTELRDYFEEEGVTRSVEGLWSANQPHLALSLLEAITGPMPLKPRDWHMLAFLGLRLRGTKESKIATTLMLPKIRCQNLAERSVEMGLYSTSGKVTPMGREFVSRFKDRFRKRHPVRPFVMKPIDRYPTQCEGKPRILGKTT